MPRMEALSRSEARRIALAAQGFTDRRPTGIPDRRLLRRAIGRSGLLQLDSVNVLVRAHYLPVFSRLGPYPIETLDRMADRRPRDLFEYWARAASLLPVETHPLFRWRMAEACRRTWRSIRRIATDRPGYVEWVLEQVRERGPVAAGALDPDERRRGGRWFDRSDAKIVLEWLFSSGQVTSAGRRAFERQYDIPERVLPPRVLAAPTPEPAAAHRELLRIAARALGVGTEKDLAGYFGLGVQEAHPHLAELVEAGELAVVSVEAWRQPAYLHAGARGPRRVDVAALLAPFDPLIWERARTERLFGMRYRIEIYVPAPQRVHGYYVLPFLLGDQLVGRVDLKADRQAGALRVAAAHAEEAWPPRLVGEALAVELRSMAGWLGLDDVTVQPLGDLAPALRAALAH